MASGGGQCTTVADGHLQPPRNQEHSLSPRELSGLAGGDQWSSRPLGNRRGEVEKEQAVDAFSPAMGRRTHVLSMRRTGQNFIFKAEPRARMSMPAMGTEALQEEADRAVSFPPAQDPGEVGE